MVGGVVAELVPVNLHVLGTDYPCGPAVYALTFQKAHACRSSAVSWVSIGAVLLVAGFVALTLDKEHGETAIVVFAWSVVALVVLFGAGLVYYLNHK